MARYTEGPWETDGGNGIRTVDRTKQIGIATSGSVDSAEMEANAALLADAPALLEALRQAIGAMDYGSAQAVARELEKARAIVGRHS